MSETIAVPNLEHHCKSWVVVSRVTGEAVLETYSRKIAECINFEKYEVLTAAQHLARLTAALSPTA